MTTIIVLAILAALTIGLLVQWAKGFSRRRGLHAAINTLPANTGTTKNSKRFKATAAITTRYLLGKFGADAEHIAACGASDVPIGVLTDEPAAAEDPVDVELLGLSNRTLLMVASEALTVGEDVYTAAGGKVQDLPTSAGTYYKVGKAMNATDADLDPVEVLHCHPVAVVVT